jgi:ketosteroid isomerase-like protein
MFQQVLIFLFLLTMAVTGPSCLRAQGDKAAEAVRDVLKQMIDADRNEDANELDRTLDQDYVIIRDNGVVRSRAETLDGIKSGSTKFESFEVSDLQVRVYGDTAVATFHAAIKGSRAGKDMSGEFRETRVFVKRHGAWRAVLAQRTRITGS